MENKYVPTHEIIFIHVQAFDTDVVNPCIYDGSTGLFRTG